MGNRGSDIDIAYFVWRSSTCRPVNYGAVHVWSLSQIKPAQDLYTRPEPQPQPQTAPEPAEGVVTEAPVSVSVSGQLSNGLHLRIEQSSSAVCVCGHWGELSTVKTPLTDNPIWRLPSLSQTNSTLFDGLP